MIWLGTIAKWVVKTWIGRVVASVLVGWIFLQINNARQRSVGAEQVITNSIQRGKAANETNAKIREQAKTPGAAERLLRDSCRDC